MICVVFFLRVGINIEQVDIFASYEVPDQFYVCGLNDYMCINTSAA